MEKRRLAIIGSGPAGYSAAIYTARAQLETTLFAGQQGGGQLMLTTEVENYPGYAHGIMGPELMTSMRAQAERFGAKIIDHDVLQVDFDARPFTLRTGHHQHQGDEGHVHVGHDDHEPGEHHDHAAKESHEDVDRFDAVIITTGAHSIPLGVPGEEQYIGRGVSYCAVCDAAFFRDKRVFVVGGGDAAMEDTLALTKFAKKVSVVHRRDQFRASKIMQERVLSQTDKVDVWWNSEVVEVKGNGSVIGAIVVRNTNSGEQREEPAEGLFVAIGHTPATGFLEGHITLDEKGYILTGLNGLYDQGNKTGFIKGVHDMWIHQFPTMTNISGVFAGGDNVDFRYRQAVTAAGMGVMAALDAERWLDRMV